MDFEPIIYIEDEDRQEASNTTKSFSTEETRKKVYINTLGNELAMKYLAQENIDISNVHNMHNLHMIQANFDISDIMLSNIHIDVRVVYDENLIFIPKSHFTYGLTPDIYIVLHMGENENHMKFLGFFEPKLINKNSKNNEYYFIEKEKLSHPADLKKYIENFDGNTSLIADREDTELAQNLALSLIDNDITENDKKKLINLMLKNSNIREQLNNFDRFEKISYNVATNEEFTNLQEDFNTVSETAYTEENEFESFENIDEFTEFETTDDTINIEDEFIQEQVTPVEEETPEEELLTEGEIDTPIVIDEILPMDDLLPEEDFSIAAEEEDEVKDEEELKENDISIEQEDEIYHEEISNEPEIENVDETFTDEFEDSPAEPYSLDELFTDTLPEETEDNWEPEELNIESIEPEHEDISVDDTEMIDEQALDETLEDHALETFENIESVDNVEFLCSEEDNNNIETTDFESLGEDIDNTPSSEEITFEDTDISSLDEIDTRNEEELPETTEPAETITFENLDLAEENVEPESDDEQSETVSFDEMEQINEPEEDVEEKSETIALEDFTLPEQKLTTNESATEEIQPEPVVYENSTIITNDNKIEGEIPIDINFAEQVEQNVDELEKLEVLYNDNLLENTSEDLQVKTSLPEKGKKAIIIASTIVVALAAVLIFASLNKPDNTQPSTNILTENKDELNEPQIPEENIIPVPAKPKLEDVAKEAEKNITKPKAPISELPYIDIQKLGWEVPDYVSYNDTFKKYLQSAGKSLKLTLSSDLLLATEYAYSNIIKVNITLSKDGAIKSANISQSSGSTQIDNIVLRTVNETLKVLKAPAGVIVGDNIQLTLKIYL